MTWRNSEKCLVGALLTTLIFLYSVASSVSILAKKEFIRSNDVAQQLNLFGHGPADFTIWRNLEKCLA
jgi:hypothetical protein